MVTRGIHGKINIYAREYEVTCGVCDNYEVVHRYSISEAEQDYRNGNWSKTIKYGWICFKCKEK